MALDQFTTTRLAVRNWQPVITDRMLRETLEGRLSGLLTPRVLAPLPPSFHVDRDARGLSAWIDERADESEVLLVERRGEGDLVGLLILAPAPGAADRPTLHIGYLIDERFWGAGIATELVQGLVSAAENDRPVTLLGGVDTANPASARVLGKAGFRPVPALSTPDTDMFRRIIA